MTSQLLPHMGTGFFVKTLASTIVGIVGMFYLGFGKKNQDVQKMLIGAVLIVVSMLFF